MNPNKPAWKLMPKAFRDIKNKLCPLCKRPVGEFRDEASRKEYQVAGMCQECQDAIFE